MNKLKLIKATRLLDSKVMLHDMYSKLNELVDAYNTHQSKHDKKEFADNNKDFFKECDKRLEEVKNLPPLAISKDDEGNCEVGCEENIWLEDFELDAKEFGLTEKQKFYFKGRLRAIIGKLMEKPSKETGSTYGIDKPDHKHGEESANLPKCPIHGEFETSGKAEMCPVCDYNNQPSLAPYCGRGQNGNTLSKEPSGECKHKFQKKVDVTGTWFLKCEICDLENYSLSTPPPASPNVDKAEKILNYIEQYGLDATWSGLDYKEFNTFLENLNKGEL